LADGTAEGDTVGTAAAIGFKIVATLKQMASSIFNLRNTIFIVQIRWRKADK
jgi:hypothetical protein